MLYGGQFSCSCYLHHLRNDLSESSAIKQTGGTERENKRELVRLDDHLGGKKGEWVTALAFSPKRWGENATHIHTNLRATVSHRKPSEVCCLFSQEWLKKGTDWRFPLAHITLESNTVSHRSLLQRAEWSGPQEIPSKRRAGCYLCLLP